VATTGSRRLPDTATRILDVGERLVQTRGYNGFSYADIARELGITKPSLHYHFPSKAALGEALVARYARRFFTALLEIEKSGVSPLAELEAYVAVYRSVLEADRMCLCGTLAVEHETLPEPMREALARFFEENEAWLTAALTRGRDEGTINFSGPPLDTARLVLSSLEGAMLVARAATDTSRFESTARSLLNGISHID
jgi:TetR/AcrR family transcriptional repressor of nem operon